MRAFALAALVCAATPAFAQSKKYPPVAPDKDLQEEKRSELWEGTLDPDKGPYQQLVRDAHKLVEAGDMKAALEKLDAAVKRQPKEPEAYVSRGSLFLQQKQWGKCAGDLRLADETSKVQDLTARTRLRIDLGVCQARAGFHSAAETTLMRAAANAQTLKGELLMRLGETRIALGKLDEAIAALGAALEQSDVTNEWPVRWLLALAYDRARKPSEAQHYAHDAKRFDPQFYQINSPKLPMLGQGDIEYMQGVANLYALPRPEYALLYFRRYLAVAGDSPWKRRAEEHIREISAMKLPANDTLATFGTAFRHDKPDATVKLRNEIRDALAKRMTEFRQCVAKLPGSAFEVTITKVGPRTPETARDRPIYRLPPAGVSSTNSLNVDGRGAAPDVAEPKRCLEEVAAKTAMPALTERDTHYVAKFTVVSP